MTDETKEKFKTMHNEALRFKEQADELFKRLKAAHNDKGELNDEQRVDFDIAYAFSVVAEQGAGMVSKCLFEVLSEQERIDSFK